MSIWNSLEDEDRFEARLRELRKMNIKRKRRHANQIEARERLFAADHASMSRDILADRAFDAECDADENWNHDQPI